MESELELTNLSSGNTNTMPGLSRCGESFIIKNFAIYSEKSYYYCCMCKPINSSAFTMFLSKLKEKIIHKPLAQHRTHKMQRRLCLQVFYNLKDHCLHSHYTSQRNYKKFPSDYGQFREKRCFGSY